MPRDLPGHPLRFAIDAGGTFTDLIVEDGSGFCRMYKAPTTPSDPITGVLDALAAAARDYETPLTDFLARGDMLIHGTTHAINAIITGRTARTALLTTAGHRDILVLREGGRTDPFNFVDPYPEPYIPRALTFEVVERIRPDGSVMLSLDEAALVATLELLRLKAIEAVAVCLLWSIANPVHEERVGALITEHLPGVPFTLSHRLNPVIREFRRASSAAVDASLKPLMGSYMRKLEGRLREAGFAGRTLVVTSQAGVIDARDAADAPIHIVNSGPSMAPIAGRYFAQVDEQAETAIVADTGGTTYDVSLVRKGSIPTSRETWIGPPYRGLMIGFPWVDVKSVGAGGGSIAWVDNGGLLHVGPRSAGAVPGPVAYGRGGTQPTVTDASVVLGHIDPDFFLGGAMKLDRDRAADAIRDLVAKPLGIDLANAADAIITIATENMVQAIVDITVNQGIDPRSAVLVGGGGAAGLNSVRIARRLGCPTLIIPEVGPALSAWGALMSDLKAEYHAAFFAAAADFDYDGVNAALAVLTERCRAFIDGPGKGARSSEITYKVQARYSTQAWDIEVPLRTNRFSRAADLEGFVADFHRTHEDLFAYADTASSIEIVGWTAQASCRLNEKGDTRLAAASISEKRSSRRVFFAPSGWLETPVHRFEAMAENTVVVGPAIIEGSFTTVVVDPGAVATRRASGSLSIQV